MMESHKVPCKGEFLKAKELAVTVRFENDDSGNGKLRTQQARMLICELILLSSKRGRPSTKEEAFHEAA